MLAFVVIALALITMNAGRWGVPYFSFKTERGSTCENNFSGYICESLVLADVEFWGDLDLPDTTIVEKSRYVSTHDYQLEARLLFPAAVAADGLAGLKEGYGDCLPGHPAPLDTAQLKDVCILANDDAIVGSEAAGSRIYVIGSGVRANGDRIVQLSVKSR